MAEQLSVIKLSTLEQLGDIVREGKGVNKKIPVPELRRELADLVGGSKELRPHPTYGIDFSRYTEQASTDFELSATQKNNALWDEFSDKGYFRFTATGKNPYVVIGNGVNEVADKLFCELPSNKIDNIVIKYRTSTNVPNGTCGEFYTQRTDGITWNSSSGNHVRWELENDGEWHLAIIDATAVWGNVEETYLKAFRFDFLADNASTESTNFKSCYVDVAYIYFFDDNYYAETFAAGEYLVNEVIKGDKLTSNQLKYVYKSGSKFYTGSENYSVTSTPSYPVTTDTYAVNTNLQTYCETISYNKKSGGAFTVLANGDAQNYLINNGAIIDLDKQYHTLKFYGWCNPGILSAGLSIKKFWYYIDGVKIGTVDPEKDTDLINYLTANGYLNPANARRYTINIDVSSLSDGIHKIELVVNLTDGVNSTPYLLHTWGDIYYRRNSQFVDADRNSYRVIGGVLYKNGGAFGGKYVSNYKTSSSKFIAVDPQIELVQRNVGTSTEIAFQDTFGLAIAPPLVTYKRLPMADLRPVTVIRNGEFYPEKGDGFSKVTVNITSLEGDNVLVKMYDGGANLIDGEYDEEGNPIVPEVPLIKFSAQELAGIVHLRNNAFYDNASIQEFICPETLRTIGNYAFENCPNLEKVVLNEGLEEIGNAAFSYARKITEIYLPSTLEYLNSGAFESTGITSIDFSKTKLSSIPSALLSYCHSLKEINLGKDINYIGDSAFSGTSIESIALPENLLYLGSYCFADCTELKRIEIPKGIKTLNGLFSGCSSLEEVILPDGLEEISLWTFSGCTSLRNLKLPDSVKFIQAQAFNSCSDDLFTYQDGYKLLDGWLISIPQDYNEEVLILDESYRGVVEDAITSPHGAQLAPGVYNPSSPKFEKLIVKGNHYQTPTCFQHSNLKEAILEEGVEKIGSNSFYNCYNLNKIELPSTLKSIGSGAFYGCLGLTEISLPENLEEIQSGFNPTFAYTGIKKLVIPDSVTYMDYWSLLLMPKLEELYYGNRMETIYIPNPNVNEYNGSQYVSKKSPLRKISIGRKTKSINYGYYGEKFSSLKMVIINAITPPYCAYDFFEALPSDCNIYVPAESVEDYKATWYEVSDKIKPIQ